MPKISALPVPSTFTGAAQIPVNNAGATQRITVTDVTQAINVKWYGAKGDGSTNDTAKINDALQAAKTAGKALYFPAGTYRYAEASVGVGYALLNPGVSIIGDGMIKTLFAPLTTMVDTADFMLIQPGASSDISFMEFKGFMVWPDYDGTKRGRRSIYAPFTMVTNLSKFHMHDCAIRPGNNWGIEMENVVAVNTQGVPAFSVLENNIFYDGIKLHGHGDSLTVRNNVFNTPEGSTRQGLHLYSVDGGGGVASHVTIHDNAMAQCDGGVLKVARGRNLKFFHNNVEQSYGAGSNGAVIDLDGGSGTMPRCLVRDNHIGIFGTTTVDKAIRINGCSGAEVDGNTMLSGIVITDAIHITSSAADTVVGRNAINTAVFTNSVADSSTTTCGKAYTLTLSGGAVAAGAPYTAPTFFKTRENVVMLQGAIDGGAGIATTTVVGTLPAGFRPTATQRYSINVTTAGGWTGALEINTNGQISVHTESGGVFTFASLANVFFTTTPNYLSTT